LERERIQGRQFLTHSSDFLLEILWLARNSGFGGRSKELTSGEVFADGLTVGGGTQCPSRRVTHPPQWPHTKENATASVKAEEK
jgi:hypothetical protein